MSDRRPVICAGLGYGDEGKGTIVEWFTRTLGAKLVVRFNGGAQAAHNVALADGRHHTFSQFGCGTFAGARTLLSRFMLVNPSTLLREATTLETKGVGAPLRLLAIDRSALVTTHFHVIANRLRESARGWARHGSCGMGIGETAQDALEHPEDAIRVEDAEDTEKLRRKLLALQDRKYAECRGFSLPTSAIEMRHALADYGLVERSVRELRAVADRVSIVDEAFLRSELAAGPVVFEGAQGALLDEEYGFHPHTTWSNTSPVNAWILLQDAGVSDGDTRVVGVTRAFSTRHGAGPFVTESSEFEPLVASDHNKTGDWQGRFRAGWLDLVALHYGAAVARLPDEIAVTHLDVAENAWGTTIPVCTGYRMGDPDRNLFEVGSFPDGANVRAIRYFIGETLERRARVGTALAHAKPICATRGSVKELLFDIEVATDAPVTCTSWGPKFEDKIASSLARL